MDAVPERSSDNHTRDEWSLYWRDPNLKFQEYDFLDPSSRYDDLFQ